MARKMSVDDILEELKQGEHMKTDHQGNASVDMGKIDDLIREILTKDKEEELKKDSREFTEQEKAEIEREVRVQTNSLTQRFAAIQTEKKKGHTAAIRVQMSGDLEEPPKAEQPSIGVGVEAFKEMHKARMQRVDAFVLEPKKKPEEKSQAPKETQEEKTSVVFKESAVIETEKTVVEKPEERIAEEPKTAPVLSETQEQAQPEQKSESSAVQEKEPVVPSKPEVSDKTEERSILLNAEIENTAAETIVEVPKGKAAAPKTPKEDPEEYELTEEDEYVFESQQPQVAALLRKKRRRAQVSCVLCGICAFLGILLSCVPSGKGALFLFGIIEIPAFYYGAANLLLLLLCAIANFPMFSSISHSSKKDAFGLITLLFTAACGVFFLFAPEQISSGHAVFYAPVLSLSFFASSCARVWQTKRQEQSFLFMTAPEDRYGVAIAQENAVSRELARGLSVEKEAVLASNVKVGFFDGFLTRLQKGTPMDTMYGRFALGTFLIGVLCAAGYYVLSSDLYGGLTVFSAIEVLGLGLLAPMICDLCLHGSKQLFDEYEMNVADWESILDVSDVNAAMVRATTLFPEGSVVLHGIKTFQGTRIDTAIVDAASVVCKADSVLRSMFLYIINGREELLKPVDSIRYEDLMGLTAWVDQKRILIGNRDLMIHHSIAVPKREYEDQYHEKGQDVIYLAREGELYAAFIVEFTAAESVQTMMSILTRQKIGVVVASTDAVIDADLLMRVFGLSSGEIKVIPARLHEQFDDKVQPRERMGMTFLNSGRMDSFALSLAVCKQLMRCVRFGKRLYLIGSILLAVVLTALFALGQMAALSAVTVAGGCLLLFLIYWFYQKNLRL